MVSKSLRPEPKSRQWQPAVQVVMACFTAMCSQGKIVIIIFVTAMCSWEMTVAVMPVILKNCCDNAVKRIDFINFQHLSF